MTAAPAACTVPLDAGAIACLALVGGAVAVCGVRLIQLSSGRRRRSVTSPSMGDAEDASRDAIDATIPVQDHLALRRSDGDDKTFGRMAMQSRQVQSEIRTELRALRDQMAKILADVSKLPTVDALSRMIVVVLWASLTVIGLAVAILAWAA